MKTVLMQLLASVVFGGMLYWFCFVWFKPNAGADRETRLNQHEHQFTAIGKGIAFWLLIWVLPWLPDDAWPWVFLLAMLGGHFVSLSYWHHRVRDRLLGELPRAPMETEEDYLGGAELDGKGA
ncbi:MAG: hypothetical protein U0S12_12750 [Fimbriimonadales bacterium]